jgi:S-adenosylmethionine:tRNA ribosyltransferase-isomerase
MSALLTAELRVATAPIESTGRARHDVGLLVSNANGFTETRFRRIAEHLSPGDVLVVNTSATEAASLEATWRGTPILVHVAGPSQRAGWVVELRAADLSGPVTNAQVGDCVSLVDGSSMRLDIPRAHDISAAGVRLWEATWKGRGDLVGLVRRVGSPIRYSYVPEQWPLAVYRTLFERRSREFASAEMPSAARPFTQPVLDDLTDRGISLAAIELHTGVSSPEAHEPPEPERFRVSARAAGHIELARREHRRVIAVGTTAARAVESAVGADGTVGPSAGWTDLVLSRERPARAVNAILTGWHPPEASHLSLLESIIDAGVIADAYQVAHSAGLLSHEFGDSCLLL